MDSKRNVFLCGPGGTGKTYDINEYVKTAEGIIGKTAYTGVAALNIGGSTLHSWFGVGLAHGDPLRILNKVYKRKDVVEKIKATQVLIIDEISMVGKNFFELLSYIAQNIRHSKQPFGGMRLIVSGDFLQLPPIDDEWVFKSDVWTACRFKVVRYEKFYRFTDQSYADMLTRIRVGMPTEDDIETLKNKIKDYKHYLDVMEDNPIKPTIIFSYRKDVEEINNRNLQKLTTKEVVYKAVDSKAHTFDDVLEHTAPKELRLKVGAQVMLTKNLSLEEGLCNGSRGVVVSTARDTVEVLFKNGMRLHLEAFVSDCEINGVKVSRSQIPLILAYALTIHKVQGSTIDFCVINLGPSIFCDGQAYVALSRVRSWDSLLLTSFIPESIKCNGEALEFLNSL